MTTAIQILQTRFRNNEEGIERLTERRADLADALAEIESNLEGLKGEQFGLSEAILKLQIGENPPYFKVPAPGPVPKTTIKE